jgi:5-methylcytosine-specific restriction endonuclease McrA
MKFSQRTRDAARRRQRGRCAVCGRNLRSLWEEAHHLYPDSLGGRDEPSNCAILCDTCHTHVHYEGRFRSRIVAPRSYFRYLGR